MENTIIPHPGRGRGPLNGEAIDVTECSTVGGADQAIIGIKLDGTNRTNRTRRVGDEGKGLTGAQLGNSGRQERHLRKIGIGGETGLAVVNINVARIVGRSVIIVSRTKNDAGVGLGIGGESDIAAITADDRAAAYRRTLIYQIGSGSPSSRFVAETTNRGAADFRGS